MTVSAASIWAATAAPAPDTPPSRARRAATCWWWARASPASPPPCGSRKAAPRWWCSMRWRRFWRQRAQWRADHSRPEIRSRYARHPVRRGHTDFVGKAADQVFTLIEKYAIACEARRSGWIQASVKTSHLPAIEKRMGQWAKRGARSSGSMRPPWPAPSAVRASPAAGSTGALARCTLSTTPSGWPAPPWPLAFASMARARDPPCAQWHAMAGDHGQWRDSRGADGAARHQRLYGSALARPPGDDGARKQLPGGHRAAAARDAGPHPAGRTCGLRYPAHRQLFPHRPPATG